MMGADGAAVARGSLLARTGWLLLPAAGICLSLASIPYEFRSLNMVCADLTACPLTSQSARELNALGISVQAFAGYLLALELLRVAIYLSIATVIFSRHPDDRMALFAGAFLLTFGLDPFVQALASSIWFIAPLGPLLKFLSGSSLVLFLYLFPQGRFVPGWVRWPALAVLAETAIDAFLPSSPMSITTSRPLSALYWALLLGSLVFVQVHRYRRSSSAVERQQTKWVVYGATVAATGFLALIIVLALFGKSLTGLGAVGIGDTAYLVIQLPIPLSIGMAMLRSHLWGVDVVIIRTLVYGALTVTVIVVFVVVVGGLGAMLQTRSPIGLSLAATALLAVLFQPLRERLQQGVNRLVYGQRDEPYSVLSQLGKRLEATLVPDSVLATIVETIAQTLKLPFAALALERDGAFVVAAAIGTEAGRPLRIELTYHSAVVGQLMLCPRPGESSFAPADRRLLGDLARQAGIAAHAVRVTAELRRSRERLVAAREEERRRLRRDLHDGLGPSLASVTLMADAVANLLTTDAAAAVRLLAELKAEAKLATAEVRRVVYELRPPALDELGLLAALREQAAQYTQGGLPVTVEAADELPPLPAAVEVAAYRIAQESLTNVLRHANARSCTIRLVAAGDLRLEIADDGTGVNGARAGVGLTSMRERAEELGGSWSIGPRSGGGSVVTARLPLADG